MNKSGVCRTAMATLGLLTMVLEECLVYIIFGNFLLVAPENNIAFEFFYLNYISIIHCKVANISNPEKNGPVWYNVCFP